MADFKGTIGTVPEELRGSLSSDLSLSGRLSSLGIPGNGIASIEKTSTDGLTDTYTITYDDGATMTYQITNGNGIVSAVFNDDNTLTLSFDDGTELTTGVLRGDDGEKVLLKAENNVVSYKYESDPNWTTLVDLTGFADDASNAADRATAKAEEARQSAVRAENSASDANASAGIATTKAEEAASSEEQAGISMRRAETAASDALASKNLAQEAAATAITAQDNARIYSERTLGYANNAAQSAQSASNSAASAAQSATGLSEAVASAQQSAREAASSATQAQEYYDDIDEVAVQAMEDYLDAHPAVQSVNGKTRHVVLNAEDVGALPEDTFIPSKITDLTNDSDFATNSDLSELETRLNTIADSDDQTLDQLSEIVAYIKNNKNLIDGITTGKVSVSDIVDNLTSSATNKPLSAKQGKVLKDLIDAIVIPTNVSAFTNDAGYLTEHQDISGKQDVISDLATIRSGAALGATALQAETDPTVPAWAKAATKPSYTATEVGALPDDTDIPTKTSDLTNDSGFITGMTILSYGSSTWNDFITAYKANKVVYCRASSNSNPATGSQTRLAFMAYVDNGAAPTNVEFQYYRSVSSHSASQQCDQVYVYKLTSAGTWTVTVREAMSKIAAGTNMSLSYSSGTITLNSKGTTVTNVSGATPVITAEADTRYICGEVTSLSFTPCASGICDVRFTSGSTVTVLTLPNTVKMPDWFDASVLEANTIYEINILDGVYGVVTTWAV